MKTEAKLKNPQKLGYTGKYDIQHQEYPGLQSNMKPVPDCGEKSYQGNGRLQNRKALITGGDSGIGRAVAIAFAREGADVAINYLPQEEEDAQEVKQLIEEAGRKAVLIPGNLRDESFCRQLVQEAIEQLGGLDTLVLNAGRQVALDDILKLSTEQLRETFEVNVFSMFWIVKAALPELPAGSSIITTTSIQAYQPGEKLVDYAATKCAIVGFSRALAKQIADKGIRVNMVAPGPIWTVLQVTGGQLEEDIPEFGQDTPMKRAGQPFELAGAYVFLASDESSYITAEVIGVTGGNHLA